MSKESRRLFRRTMRIHHRDLWVDGRECVEEVVGKLEDGRRRAGGGEGFDCFPRLTVEVVSPCAWKCLVERVANKRVREPHLPE